MNLSTPERIQRWHENKHGGPQESCWECTKQRAKCRSKRLRVPERDEAERVALERNLATGYSPPVVHYLCGWCGLYHLTSRLRHRRDRVEKQRRKWMTKQEMERRGISS